MRQEEIRKGPWTEQEDILLINFVHLFGDRRWDFVAKVSGLNRTGKSCRLRWVNYLHPGLKRGKMTPEEEKLVLELHQKWGNRWSRIARKLPGRTDNEIKNYWRTHMRKKAQQKKRDMSPSSSSSSTSCCESNITTPVDSTPFPEPEGATFYDTGGKPDSSALGSQKIGSTEIAIQGEKGYSLDDIWRDIESNIDPFFSEEGCDIPCPSMASPVWDYCSDTLWKLDEEEGKMHVPYEYGTMFLPG